MRRAVVSITAHGPVAHGPAIVHCGGAMAHGATEGGAVPHVSAATPGGPSALGAMAHVFGI